MKRIITVFVVGFTLLSSAKAQVSFGVKAGGALTSIPGTISNKSKSGLYGGITAGIPLKKGFSLHGELYYSQQGNKQPYILTDEWGNEVGKGKSIYKLNYINLPVLIRYALPKGFYAETGLQAGLLVGAKMKIASAKIDIKDYYESFDLSLPFGIGYTLKNGLGANLRYNVGLTNVYKTKIYSPKNKVVQLGLFYNLKKN